MVDFRSSLLDVVTHAKDFRSALEFKLESAEVKWPDIDDKSYWEKQIRTFENIQITMKTLMGKADIQPDVNAVSLSAMIASGVNKVRAFELLGISPKHKFKLQVLTPGEQIALSFSDFHDQITTGGIQKYIESGSAAMSGDDGLQAHAVLLEFAEEFYDINPVVADKLKSILEGVKISDELKSALDDVMAVISEGSVGSEEYEPDNRRFLNGALEGSERDYLQLDEDEIVDFIENSIKELDPDKKPFLDGVKRLEPESVFSAKM